MTITQNDLEILATEVMADTPDGGGLPTAIPIVDGVSNNLFPDVSDLDAVNGRVRLRKIVMAVKTATAELLQAARFLITELPNNPNISVFAFQPTAFADRRAAAKNKIESYLAPGTKWSGHILEMQLEGQKVVQITLDPKEQAPKVGDALILVQNEMLVDEFYQYVRVQNVSSVNRDFTVVTTNGATKEVNRKVVTLEISQPLKQNFNGMTVNEYFNLAPTARRAILRGARVTDAARYYSASRLAEPVTALSTRKVRVESVYTKIVPASTIPTTLPLIDPVGRSTALVKGSDGNLSINQSVSVNPSTPWVIGSRIYPSSLSISVNGIAMTDVNGELQDSSAVLYGAVNYETGIVNWYETANFGIKTITGSFTPAGALLRVSQSEIMFTPETEVGASYIRYLQAKPTNGSVTVSFQVSGEVTTIHDDGNGSLIYGDGNKYGIVDVASKLVQLILPVIPDAQSAIIYSYSTDLGTETLGGQTVGAYFEYDVADYLAPGSTITWGGKTATLSGGKLTGDATGTYDGTKLRITPNEIPEPNTVFTVNYSKVNEVSQVKRGTIASSSFTGARLDVNIGGNNSHSFVGVMTIASGEWQSFGEAYGQLPFKAYRLIIADDGTGNIVTVGTHGVSHDDKLVRDLSLVATGTVSGTGAMQLFFDLTANHVKPGTSLAPDPTANAPANFVVKKSVYNEIVTSLKGKVNSVSIEYVYIQGVTTTTPSTLPLTAAELKVTLPSITSSSKVLTDSVSIMGAKDSGGSMVKGAETVGTIDYQSGKIAFSDWTTTANPLLVNSTVREYLTPPVAALVFRTPAAPIQNGTLGINLKTGSSGTQLLVTADSDGVINESGITGFIDYQSGVIAIYGADIDPDSVSYSAVSYSYMPLDAEQIGLDPVRLPMDGRVRFVNVGDTVAITELKTMLLSTNAVGDNFDFNSERLSDVTIVDSEGIKVTENELNLDLDAGTAGFNGAFDVSLYTPPFTAKYRIMDLGKVDAVDISGRVTLSNTITHDYTTDAVFSSMLIAGDMQSRVANVFSQKTWTAEWSDELIGDRAESQLQTASAPIVVANNDTITERWAIVFTGSTSFRIIGETVGEIAVSTTSASTAPLNPATSNPYFTIPKEAWGGGWDAGNVVRFNTVAAAYPVWVGNAIQQHQLSRLDTYDFSVSYHANVDRERL